MKTNKKGNFGFVLLAHAAIMLLWWYDGEVIPFLIDYLISTAYLIGAIVIYEA